MPLVRVTLMAPASATRPDAVTEALLEATRPLLIPIETAPVVQAAFDEAIWTLHSPSNFAAAAGVAKTSATKSAVREARDILLMLAITFPCVSCAASVS